MSEQALYRKYRSASFDDVIGQPQVVDTLKNAIASDRLSHAYLFTGPRGVGKTSVARLLGRAANCTHKDPAKRPCGECENCKLEIGAHLDLIEIDAASNRGIDDARALREKITSAPSMGRYKVYIIDEVHMLTTEAFNALLKTLEEPPAHAIFILATTESHKLPETIVSRTQRFSFRPIDNSNLVAHLKEIANREGVKADDAAIELLAQTSRGGFRDAISLLDQVATSGISPLTEADVRRLLGQSTPEIIQKITKAITAHDAQAALAGIDEALGEGVQAGQLAGQLIDHWRAALRASVAKGDDTLTAQLVIAIETVMPVLKSAWPELSLEAALVRVAAGIATAGVATSARPAAVSSAMPSKQAAPAASSKAPAAPAAASGTAPDPDLWMKALAQIKAKHNALYALLNSCTITFKDDDLLVTTNFTFFRDRLNEGKNVETIEGIVKRVYGRPFRVVPQLAAQSSVASTPAGEQNAELVSSALEILGGEVVHE